MSSVAHDVSSPIVEALRRLPQPLVFLHPIYAVAAIPSRDTIPFAASSSTINTNSNSNSISTTTCTHSINSSTSIQYAEAVGVRRGKLSKTITRRRGEEEELDYINSFALERNTTVVESIRLTSLAQELFERLLCQSAEVMNKIPLELKSKRKRRLQKARVLITSTVMFPSTVPLVVELMQIFLSQYGRQRSVIALSCYLKEALEFMLYWSHPSMGYTVSAHVKHKYNQQQQEEQQYQYQYQHQLQKSELEVFADVLYTSPLLLRPWTEHAVLMAMASAPECTLCDLCGSRRLAAWIHRYITIERLEEYHNISVRREGWEWLQRLLSALMSRAEILVFTRTLCALLIALEVELIPGNNNNNNNYSNNNNSNNNSNDDDISVVPRDKKRDGEGLRLLLGILADRAGHTVRKDKREERFSVNNDSNSDYDSNSDNNNSNDIDSNNDDLFWNLDAHMASNVKREEDSIAQFLREQPTCVEFITIPANTQKGRIRISGNRTNQQIAVRRLCGVVDELYRFLSEWIRLTVNAELRRLAAHITLKQETPNHNDSNNNNNNNNTNRNSNNGKLSRLTVVVSRVLQTGVATSSPPIPFSYAPVNLMSDMIMKEQLRYARNEKKEEEDELLNCTAAKSFMDVDANYTNSRKTMEDKGGSRRIGHVYKKTVKQGEKKLSLFDIPLWTSGDDNNSDSDSDNNNDDSVLTDGVEQSTWFSDIIIAGAVRYLDQSPTLWQRRALSHLQDIITAISASLTTTTNTNISATERYKHKSFLRLGAFSSKSSRLSSPLLLLLLLVRHAHAEVRYKLSSWHFFPSLPCSVNRKEEWRTNRNNNKKKNNNNNNNNNNKRNYQFLQECLDPQLLSHKGLLGGDPPWTKIEADYLFLLLREYRRLIWRARLALQEGNTPQTTISISTSTMLSTSITLGLHLITAPLDIQHPTEIEITQMRTAIDISLASYLLPRPTQDERFSVVLPFSVFSTQYGGFAANISFIARDDIQPSSLDENCVERLCLSLGLPKTSFHLMKNEIGLTTEAMEYLLQLAKKQQEQEEEEEEENEDDEITVEVTRKDPLSSAIPDVNSSVAHNTNSNTNNNNNNNNKTTATPVGVSSEGIFTSFPFHSHKDMTPLTLEEWYNMIDEMLAPSSSPLTNTGDNANIVKVSNQMIS